MENTTVNSRLMFLSNVRSSWLQEIFTLCMIVPMGLIGTVLNLMSLSIFLKKSIQLNHSILFDIFFLLYL